MEADLGYDDPAFSSDPHAHPFFPSLHPRCSMFSDDHSSTTHESSSSSNHTSTTLSTPPTSTDSHSEKSAPLRWPPEVQKKKKTLAMFWRRSPPETVLASVNLTRNVSPNSLPSRNMTPRPLPARNVTVPDMNVSFSRPNLSRRFATATADFKPPPLASRRTAGGLAMRGSELDRIDELDESNPIGLPLHHGGPYEAVHKSTSQKATETNVPHNIGSQYQERERAQERIQRSHRRNLSDVTSVPVVPAGVSLNLSPGQILPHGFYQQFDSSMPAISTPSNAPGWPPQHHHSRYQPQPRTHGRLQTQPHLYSSQDILINHDTQQARLDGSLVSSRPRNSPPEYSALPTDHYLGIGGPNNAGLRVPRTSSSEAVKELNHDLDGREQSIHLVKEQQYYPGTPINSLPDFRASTPGSRHYHQSNNRLPPRMQALQKQIPRSDEKRRPSRSPNGKYDYAAYPGGSFMPVQAGHLHQYNIPPMVDNVHQVPLFVDNNGLPAPAPVPPSFEVLQPVQVQTQLDDVPLGLDSRSGRSIHSSLKSTNSRYPRDAPPPHHLPKRLVMPTPLQTSQPVPSRHQPQPQPPPRHLSHHIWQPQSDPPLPLEVPVALNPYIESQLRAEDIQMSQSRKLRKRSSVQAVPQPTFSSVLPSQPLSFEPTPTYHDVPSLQPLSIRKPEKSHKRVLSKRRLEY